MKRFIAVLSGLLVLPAFAEVAPVYYDEIVEYTDDMLAEEESEHQQPSAAQRNTINRSTSASRAVSSVANSTSSRTNTSSRAMATSPRKAVNTARGTVSRTARTGGVVNRPASTTSRASVTARGAQTAKPVTARSARVGTANNTVMSATTRALSGNPTSTINDSGKSLYNASGTARVSVATRRSPSSGIRLSTSALTGTATTPVITEEDVSSTTSTLTAVAELTDYCKAQYAACMDNYCNVLDDNQGRCSCSKNLKNYAKTEEALEAATEQYQEAIQKIKYVYSGLTKSQIEALFSETEAELSMKENSDSSQIKNSLDAIKRKVVDVSSPTASSTYNTTSGFSLDLDFEGLLSSDLTSNFDLGMFVGTNSSSSTNSISNQRGEQLYKTATNRCKTVVLNSCTAQGIDANVITNSYDLEIDKQCIAYERALTEANKEMKNNVFNATNVLQVSRLKLSLAKNSYDLRGCVAAIDSCMQSEYVCGSDYELCLDPTGKYLANGEVVKGGTPGVSGGQNKNTADYDPGDTEWTSGGMYDLYATWNYPISTSGSSLKNAWSNGQNENLAGYVNDALTKWGKDYADFTDTSVAGNMALYLLQKIGYIDSNDKVHGMCASVMQQCQDYTFNNQKSSKKFIPDNEVVRMYLNNTLAKIKVQQDALLANYAEGCRQDVQSCLTSNGYNESNTSLTASKTAVNACAAEIATCMSVSGYTPKDGTKLTLSAMNDWVASININCPANTYLSDNGSTTKCMACPKFGSIQTVSAGGQVTRCSCPTDQEYTELLVDEEINGVTTGKQILAGCSLNGEVSCNVNYYVSNGTCVACPSNGYSNGGTVTKCNCREGSWISNACVVSAYNNGSGGTLTPGTAPGLSDGTVPALSNEETSFVP